MAAEPLLPGGTLYFEEQPVSGVAELFDGYDAGKSESAKSKFASSTRSTIPLRSLLLGSSILFRQVLALLGVGAATDLHFEFSVNAPRGRGKDSFTQLTFIAGRACHPQ